MMMECSVAYDGQPLTGKAALVTGGSRGIGAAITRKLAAWDCTVCCAGDAVVLSSRQDEKQRRRRRDALCRPASARRFRYTFESADFNQPDRRNATVAGGDGSSTSHMAADNVP